MGSGGSIYDPVGNSLDCGDRREIMGGNGMQRGVLTAPTRQENIRDKSMLVIFSSPQSPPPCLITLTPSHLLISSQGLIQERRAKLQSHGKESSKCIFDQSKNRSHVSRRMLM